MSKHKHFHQIKNPRQMLQHGRREGIGPLVPPGFQIPQHWGQRDPRQLHKS